MKSPGASVKPPGTFLGTFPVTKARTPFAKFGPVEWALHFIERYGGIDGGHHKQWVIDQTARILNGAPVEIVEARWDSGLAEYRVSVGTCDAYVAWVADMKSGEDGPNTYDWEEGIPP